MTAVPQTASVRRRPVRPSNAAPDRRHPTQIPGNFARQRHAFGNRSSELTAVIDAAAGIALPLHQNGTRMRFVKLPLPLGAAGLLLVSSAVGRRLSSKKRSACFPQAGAGGASRESPTHRRAPKHRRKHAAMNVWMFSKRSKILGSRLHGCESR